MRFGTRFKALQPRGAVSNLPPGSGGKREQGYSLPCHHKAYARYPRKADISKTIFEQTFCTHVAKSGQLTRESAVFWGCNEKRILLS
jgi:hypothetical protein